MKIRKNVDFEKRVGSEIVVVKNAKLYKFNREGAIIWKYVDKLPLDLLCREIANLKKREITEVKGEVMKFLRELSALGIIDIIEDENYI